MGLQQVQVQPERLPNVQSVQNAQGSSQEAQTGERAGRPCCPCSSARPAHREVGPGLSQPGKNRGQCAGQIFHHSGPSQANAQARLDEKTSPASLRKTKQDSETASRDRETGRERNHMFHIGNPMFHIGNLMFHVGLCFILEMLCFI